MEIDTLKDFGTEVGLKDKEMKKLDEEDLTLEILKRIDQSKQYSDEFCDWYEALPPSYFKKKDKKSEEDDDNSEDEKEDKYNKEFFAGILDDIDENSKSLKKLKKICEKYDDIFPAKLLKIDEAEELEEKMQESLEKFKKAKEEKGKKEKKEKGNDDNETKTTEKKGKGMKIDKDTQKELKKKINAADDIAELKEIAEDSDYEKYFEDVTLKKKDDVDEKKEEMLKAIGIGGDEEESNGIDEKLQKKLAKKINAADDISELKEIAGDSDYEKYFEDVVLKKKDDVDDKKEEMLKAIGIGGKKKSKKDDDDEDEKPKKKKAKKDDDEEEDEKPKKKSKKDDDESEISDKVKAKLEKKINAADDISELKEIAEDSDYEKYFEDIVLKKKDDVDDKKAEMLKAIGIGKKKAKKSSDDDDEEDEKPKKKKAKKDVDPEDVIDEKMEEWDGFSIGKLKATAKRLGVKTAPDMKKKEIMKLMKKAFLDGASDEEVDEKDEIELTPSVVKKMLKEKDLDGLQEAAKKAKLDLSSVAMKSSNKIADALIEYLSEDDKPKKKSKKDDDDDDDDTDSDSSIYKKIKAMVKDEESDKKIIKKLTPLFEKKGKDEDYAEKKIKQLIKVIKIELEEDED